jgi:hypothetical protein
MKQELGKESYTDECTRKQRMRTIWLKEGIRKLRGIRRGSDRGRYHLGLGGGDAKHMLLRYAETKKWRELIFRYG